VRLVGYLKRNNEFPLLWLNSWTLTQGVAAPLAPPHPTYSPAFNRSSKFTKYTYNLERSDGFTGPLFNVLIKLWFGGQSGSKFAWRVFL